MSNVKRDKHTCFSEELVEWEDREHESNFTKKQRAKIDILKGRKILI